EGVASRLSPGHGSIAFNKYPKPASSACKPHAALPMSNTRAGGAGRWVKTNVYSRIGFDNSGRGTLASALEASTPASEFTGPAEGPLSVPLESRRAARL